jgi:hypothetical protein
MLWNRPAGFTLGGSLSLPRRDQRQVQPARM